MLHVSARTSSWRLSNVKCPLIPDGIAHSREKGLVIRRCQNPRHASTIGKSVKDLNIPRDSKMALIIPNQGGAYVPTSLPFFRVATR
jgi:hypothetical protein